MEILQACLSSKHKPAETKMPVIFSFARTLILVPERPELTICNKTIIIKKNAPSHPASWLTTGFALAVERRKRKWAAKSRP